MIPPPLLLPTILTRLGFVRVPDQPIAPIACKGCGEQLTLDLWGERGRMIHGRADPTIGHAGTPCDWFLAELAKP